MRVRLLRLSVRAYALWISSAPLSLVTLPALRLFDVVRRKMLSVRVTPALRGSVPGNAVTGVVSALRGSDAGNPGNVFAVVPMSLLLLLTVRLPVPACRFTGTFRVRLAEDPGPLAVALSEALFARWPVPGHTVARAVLVEGGQALDLPTPRTGLVLRTHLRPPRDRLAVAASASATASASVAAANAM